MNNKGKHNQTYLELKSLVFFTSTMNMLFILLTITYGFLFLVPFIPLMAYYTVTRINIANSLEYVEIDIKDLEEMLNIKNSMELVKFVIDLQNKHKKLNTKS